MPEVNKSKAIRDYYKKHPKAKAQEVVGALAKSGITTTTNYVMNLKSRHNKRRKAVRMRVCPHCGKPLMEKKVIVKGGVGIPEIQAALALIKLTGSLKAATQALAVAQEIRAIV